MAQMKEQIKSPEKDLNKISNLSDAEFKTLVSRMLNSLVRTSAELKRSSQK